MAKFIVGETAGGLQFNMMYKHVSSFKYVKGPIKVMKGMQGRHLMGVIVM